MIKNKEFVLLLNELMQKEIEILRKRFRPYERRPFLSNNITIDLDLKYKDGNVLGYYENTQKNEKKWRFTHKIFITELSKEKYERYAIEWNWKRKAIKDLRSTIRHELIHAFVFEEFDLFEDIKHCNGDYSPIFLSCLYWGNEEFVYPYTDKFKETDLYKSIEKCSKFDMVYTYLIDYILKLNRAVRKINQDINSDIKNYKNLKIEFNQRGAGIVKRTYVSCITRTKKDKSIYIQKATEMTLGIGFLVKPKDIIENYARKFNNGIMANVHSEIGTYVIGNEFKQKRIIRES